MFLTSDGEALIQLLTFFLGNLSGSAPTHFLSLYKALKEIFSLYFMRLQVFQRSSAPQLSKLPDSSP